MFACTLRASQSINFLTPERGLKKFDGENLCVYVFITFPNIEQSVILDSYKNIYFVPSLCILLRKTLFRLKMYGLFFHFQESNTSGKSCLYLY